MTIQELVFEPHTPADLEQLKVLGIAAYGAYSDIFDEDSRTAWMKNLQSDATYQFLIETSEIFVSKSNERIVGMAYLISNGHPTDIYDAGWCYIRFLAVHPDYTGLGIARTLTKMCIDEATKNGEKTIALHTSEFMDAARHIYESIGFKKLKEIPLRFGKRYWVYTMDL